jgi:hypothetical protein
MTASRKFAQAPGPDQIAEWKRALADHRRGQRARRWKRPEPQITGIIRVRPPTDNQEQKP